MWTVCGNITISILDFNLFLSMDWDYCLIKRLTGGWLVLYNNRQIKKMLRIIKENAKK